MKRLLREPLFHFLLIGVALFGAYQLVRDRQGESPRDIIVTQGRIAHLTERFTKTWQRKPTATELDGLIKDYIHEEVYCREAVALGLDKDDIVIRRRLSEKMQFVSDDMADTVEQTEAQRDSAKEKFFQDLLKHYTITIEPPARKADGAAK